MTIDSTFDRLTIHDLLPSGFSYADAVQSEAYSTRGYVPGARKLCVVRTAEGSYLAVRLGPPTGAKTLGRRGYMLRDARNAGVNPALEHRLLEWYVREYNTGFMAGRRSARGGPTPRAWDSGHSSAAYDDGYLDAVADRPKWHLAHCVDHDACGEA